MDGNGDTPESKSRKSRKHDKKPLSPRYTKMMSDMSPPVDVEPVVASVAGTKAIYNEVMSMQRRNLSRFSSGKLSPKYSGRKIFK